MKKFFFLAAGVLSLASSLSWAVEDRVRVATVFDKRTAAVNEEIRLSIRITGSRANVLKPRLPVLNDFESYYTGRTNQFTFVDGHSESTTTFNYILVPRAEGQFTLPPIEVEVERDIFRTDPIEITVMGRAAPQQAPVAPAQPAPSPGAAASPAAAAAAKPPVSSVQQPQANVSLPGSRDDIFLNVAADRLEVYPNEQILLTYSVFTRVSARAEQFEKDPNLSGFWVEEIPIEKDYQPERVVYGGVDYLKADVRRLALFPTSTGVLEMDPGLFRVTVKKESRPSSLFDDFFDESFFGGSFFARRETLLLSANPIKVVVRPLPEQGKPSDFSGMVGSFQMSSTVEKRSVKQNEPLLYTLVIEGAGNIETMERPQIREAKNMKFYDTDSRSELIRDRAGVRGRKVFEVTFIPTEAGAVEIPALAFSYFDPRRGSYQTLKTPPYQIQVSPGPAVALPASLGEKGAAQELKKTVQREETDIHFIKEAFVPEKKAPLVRLLPFLAGGNGLLTFVYLVLWVRRAQEERLSQNVSLRRSRTALRVALKDLKKLVPLSRSKDGAERRRFFAEAPHVLDNYLADKFNLSAQGLTFVEIEARLRDKGMNGAEIEALRQFYEQCNHVRFASSAVPETKTEELMHIMRNVFSFLEKRP